MKILRKISNLAFLLAFTLPAFVWAACTNDPSQATSELPSCATVGVDNSFKFANPIKATSVSALLNQLLDFFVQLGVVAVTMGIIYSGFLYATARGNTSKITKAHETFYLTIIGAAIVLGAFAITQVVGDTAKQLFGN